MSSFRYSRLWAWIQRHVLRRPVKARFVVKGGSEALLNYRVEDAEARQDAIEKFSLPGEPIEISGYFPAETDIEKAIRAMKCNHCQAPLTPHPDQPLVGIVERFPDVLFRRENWDTGMVEYSTSEHWTTLYFCSAACHQAFGVAEPRRENLLPKGWLGISGAGDD